MVLAGTGKEGKTKEVVKDREDKTIDMYIYIFIYICDLYVHPDVNRYNSSFSNHGREAAWSCRTTHGSVLKTLVWLRWENRDAPNLFIGQDPFHFWWGHQLSSFDFSDLILFNGIEPILWEPQWLPVYEVPAFHTGSGATLRLQWGHCKNGSPRPFCKLYYAGAHMPPSQGGGLGVPLPTDDPDWLPVVFNRIWHHTMTSKS